MVCGRTAKNTKVSLKWNSLCGVLRHNSYVIHINFGARFARTRFLPLRAQVRNSLFLPMPPRLLRSAIVTTDSLTEGRTGVFPWFFLSVKREFRKLFFVTRDPKVLLDLWKTWIIIYEIAKARFKRRILPAPNRIAELSACKMRRLNQLNATYFNSMRVSRIFDWSSRIYDWNSTVDLNPLFYMCRIELKLC